MNNTTIGLDIAQRSLGKPKHEQPWLAIVANKPII
jgi:hypothetical protein